MSKRSVVGMALAVAVVGGCAHLPPSSSHGASDTITADQIVKTEATTAYEVIQRLEPKFLVSRGPTDFTDPSSGMPNVYLDDVAYGPVSTLNTIPAGDISMIRIYRAWEATYKFGTGNMGGVIAVYSKH